MPQEKIETILDYNPTDEEWKRFGGKDLFLKRQSWFNKYPDDAKWQLGLLFSMRGNNKKANEYWSQMTDKSRLQLLWQDF